MEGSSGMQHAPGGWRVYQVNFQARLVMAHQNPSGGATFKQHMPATFLNTFPVTKYGGDSPEIALTFQIYICRDYFLANNTAQET